MLSLLLVIVTTIITDRAIAMLTNRIYRCPEIQQLNIRQQQSKVIVIQALAYVIGFILTLLFPFMIVRATKFQHGLAMLRAVFLPIQGFFNMLIFISHKIYNYTYRRRHPEVGRWQVLKLLFQTSVEKPVFISRLFIVQNDAEEAHRQEKTMYEVSFDDEMGELKSFTISNQDEECCSGPSVTFELQSMGQAHVSIGNGVLHEDEEGMSNCLSGFDDSKGCAKSEEGLFLMTILLKTMTVTMESKPPQQKTKNWYFNNYMKQIVWYVNEYYCTSTVLARVVPGNL